MYSNTAQKCLIRNLTNDVPWFFFLNRSRAQLNMNTEPIKPVLDASQKPVRCVHVQQI